MQGNECRESQQSAALPSRLKVTWYRAVGVFVLLTQRVKGIDRSFVQVKVDVFRHRERFIFPVLSPKADKSLFD